MYITGDNSEVKWATADLCGLPLIGCASHKINLAVKGYLDRHSQTLAVIHSVMLKLKTPKVRGELRQFTKLQPIFRNKTRWLSSLKRYQDFWSYRRTWRS